MTLPRSIQSQSYIITNHLSLQPLYDSESSKNLVMHQILHITKPWLAQTSVVKIAPLYRWRSRFRVLRMSDDRAPDGHLPTSRCIRWPVRPLVRCMACPWLAPMDILRGVRPWSWMQRATSNETKYRDFASCMCVWVGDEFHDARVRIFSQILSLVGTRDECIVSD
jgi:hypothetical protein